MKNVESFYPLSPMQEGMLFHSLLDYGAGLYVEVLSVRLTGNLNIDAFKAAWQKCLARHPVLRTSFIWEGTKEPIQVVHQSVQLPFTYLDWRDQEHSNLESQLQYDLYQERKQGFDLSHAPLFRLKLIQTHDDAYQFIWIHHHILLDGWSIPILLGEVMQQYQAINRKLVVELPPVRPYKDYILWLKSHDLAKSETFWRKKLAGFSSPTPLLFSRAGFKSSGETPQFSGVEILLSENLSEELNALARKYGLTLNTLLESAWAILLSHYSGQKDIVYGKTISGRPSDLAGSEQMVGLFINTLPVRVQIREKENVIAWMRLNQSLQAEMLQYEYTPLAQIQSWSEVPRGTALFDLLYVFENLPLGNLGSQQTGALRIDPGQGESYTNYPLTFVIVPARQLSVKITYDTRWFDAEIIAGMLDHFQVILQGIVANPSRTIDSISLLSEVERQKILFQWNNSITNYPSSKSLAELFEAQVKRTPQAIAVSFPKWDKTLSALDGTQGKEYEFVPEKSLSYEALNIRANQLANYLQELGVGPDIPVGIYMERSLDMLVATLAIIKAGGVYLPLDLSYPAERLAFMLQDSKVTLVITTSEYIQGQCGLIEAMNVPGNLPEQSQPKLIKLIFIDDAKVQEILNSQSSENLACLVNAESLAYIMYTSGSTGRPKGVAVLHRGIIRLVLNTNYIQFTSTDRVAHASNPSFDAATFEIWGALLSGCTLIGVPKEIALSPSDYAAYLRNNQITILLITTALFNHIAREIPEAFANLKYLLFGGEAADAEAIRQVLNQYKRPQYLINAYGPTEGTCISTYYEIDEIPYDATSVPIGRPISNTQVYILSWNHQPVPVGVPGEIYIGGDGLARGYHNRPEITAEVFIDTPLIDEYEKYLMQSNLDVGKVSFHERRLYKTGDLARYTADGNIHFMGRADYQVKLHGLRIELGEIESSISQFPQVKENIVLLREDQKGEKRLVAYLVAKDHQAVQFGELRSFLKDKLPDFMIPAVFVHLAHMPITPNGKVDRNALPIPEGVRPELEAAYVEPVTETEKRLAVIFAQTLGLDRVGLLDNFFDLGGDSILSLQVISRARKDGLHISYRQLFEHPILQDLASQVDQEEGEIIEEPGAVGGKIPLTPIQRWFFEHHSKAPHHFNTSLMVEVNYALKIDLVSQVLSNLINAHESFRTYFINTPDGWQQFLAGPPGHELSLPVSYLDMSSLSSVEQVQTIQEDAEARQASLDLGKPPLLSVVYYDLGKDNPHRLLFIFHHLIFDGVSARIFVDDFINATIQLLGQGAVQLPAKTTSYQLWAQRLEQTAQLPIITDQLEYWLQYFGKPVDCLPMSCPDGLNTYGLAEQFTSFLSEAETEAILYDLPAFYKVSSYVILLTALIRLYRDSTGKAELLVELEGHGREEIAGTPLDGLDLSRTIGWFTSIFPISLQVDSSLSIGAQLAAIARQIAEIPHRGIGFGLLKYMNGNFAVREKISAIPDPAINFNYLGQFDLRTRRDKENLVNPPSNQVNNDHFEKTVDNFKPPFQIISEPVGHEQDPDSPRSAKLYIVAAVSVGQLGVRWLYSRDQYDKGSIQRYAELYLDELRAIISDHNDCG